MTLVKLILKNVGQRWIRFLLTGLAVVLGVGFVVGTFIVTDGLRSTFGDLATDISSGADLFIQADTGDFDNELLASPIDPSLVEQVVEVDGVEFAEGAVFRPGVNVVDDDGSSLGSGFRAGLSFGRSTTTFLVTDGPSAGSAPTGPDEFAINKNAAEEFDLVVGEQYEVEALGGVRQMTLVGTFNWADPDDDQTVAGSLVAFDLATAIDFLAGGAGLSQIGVGVEAAADELAVQAELERLVGPGFTVISNEQNAEDDAADFDEFLDVFGNILLSFAIVTLVVSAFIIYNTFSIVIGQRIRELGLLRALGASGRQITGSIIGESFIIGVAATAIGIVAGIGLGWALREILLGLGAEFPQGPLPIRGRTLVVAIILGVGATVFSAVVPALRARRVSPMAALRDDVGLGSTGARLRPRLGIVLIAVGIVALVLGILSGGGIIGLGVLAAILLYFGGSRTRPFLGRASILVVGLVMLVVAAVADLSTAALLGALAVGALLTFVGVNLVSPLFARPVSALIGRRFLGVVLLVVGGLCVLGAIGAVVLAAVRLTEGSVGAAIGLLVAGLVAVGLGWLCLNTWRAPWGVEGRMGTANAGRTPRRTAATAAALMIGLALVGTVTVIGSSLKKTFDEVLDRSVTADWFICLDDCNSFFDGFSPEMTRELAALDELETVIPYRFAENALRTVADDEIHDVLTADFAQLDEHLDPDFISGGSDDAGATSLLLHEDSAEDRDLAVGDLVEVEFATGEPAMLEVAGIFSDARVLGNWVISNEAYARYLPPTEDQFASAVSAEGFDEEEVRAALDAVAANYPDVEVRTKDEFRDSQAAQVDQTLVVINVFLALALIIALVGIANTLALSVFERTREIGLLRAVGATGAQTSMLIRWEGAIIAVFGGILGVALGIVFGIIAVIVIPDSIVSSFDIPPGQLAIYLVIAGLAGLVAGYFPARRAARLDVLEAISYE